MLGKEMKKKQGCLPFLYQQHPTQSKKMSQEGDKKWQMK